MVHVDSLVRSRGRADNVRSSAANCCGQSFGSYDAQTSKLYDDGQLKIDYADFAVFCQEQNIKLTRKEFALLSILSRNKGRVVPREQLLDQVWGLEYYGEARTLDVHISGLRKKLGACGNCIETVIGIGYRFRACNEISDGVMG